MLNFDTFNSIDSSKALSYNDFNRNLSHGDYDKSIFTSPQDNVEEGYDNVTALYEQLDAVEDQQGVITKGWNGIKEATGLGTSVEKCNEAIEKYKNGEITFEEASAQIDEFSAKQSSSLNLFSNIATSILAIGAIAAVTVATAGVGTAAAIAIGAGTGAVAKTGFKLTDRATNDVEGDALDGKQMAKDALSGAITGGMAAATMGTAGSAATVKGAVTGCAKTGVKTGAISGAANYSIDCAFDDEQDFNAKDLIVSTGTGAVVGGAVGGIMGGINGSLHANGILNSGCNLQSMVSSAENASIKNVAANSACTTSYKVLNDRIRAIAA